MTWGSIKFVYHIDGDGANLVDSMDLLNFANGFELAEGGWVQQVPAGDNVTLIETLNFRVRATSQDQLATRLQVLDNWITRVNYYQSKAMRTAVWLRVQVNQESQPRQALITRMQYAISESAFGAYWADSVFIGNLTIVLERSAFWEEITPQSEALGNAENYTLDTLAAVTSGDVPSRIWYASCDATQSDRQNTLYFGYKNDRYYNPANFSPRRSLNAYEAGVGTGGAFGSDVNTTGGKRLRVTFGTAALTQRHSLPLKYLASFNGVTITLTTLTNDYIRGDYLCLMRARIFENTTPTTITRARIKIGYVAATGDKIYPRVTITDESWHLYEMGVIRLPLDRSSAHQTVLDTAIKLDAELISGDGFLDVDCYVLIPLEGALKIYSNDGIVSGVGALARNGLIETNPTWEIYGYTIDDVNGVYDVVQVAPFDWSIPTSSAVPNVLVGAIDADSTESLIDTGWDMSVSSIRRWRTLRGNE